MVEPKLQQFGHWVSKITQRNERITFKLLSGHDLALYKPFHFGSGFVAGSVSAGSDDRIAVRFDAVAAVRGQANKGRNERVTDKTSAEQVS
jgi:hypothetical protein